jgi:hypothetical protein
MGATGGKKGYGTLFEKEDPVDSGTFVVAAEVKSISGPSMSRDSTDATHMESPDEYEETMPTLKKGGEVSLVLNFRPDHASHSALLADFESGIVRKWRIRWPQFGDPNKSLTFPGWISGWEPTTAIREWITVAVKIMVTGKPVPANFA